jgi:hypothetical protein
MAAPTWNATDKEKYKTLAQLSIGLIVGTIVLLPSIVGLVHPPYVMKWAVPLMLGLSVIAVALLGWALIATLAGTSSPPIRMLGAGNWFGLAVLALLVAFILVNMLSDSSAPPRIVAITVDPPSVEPDQYVQLDVEATDQDGDALSYAWTFDEALVSSRRNAYVKAPAKPGLYRVELRIRDDRCEKSAVISFEVEAHATAVAAATESSPDAPAVREDIKTASKHRGVMDDCN